MKKLKVGGIGNPPNGCTWKIVMNFMGDWTLWLIDEKRDREYKFSRPIEVSSNFGDSLANGMEKLREERDHEIEKERWEEFLDGETQFEVVAHLPGTVEVDIAGWAHPSYE